jgi:hypothetical protein
MGRMRVEQADPEIARDGLELAEQSGERGVREWGRCAQVSMPKNVVSWEMRFSSRTPSATSCRASATTLSTVRLRCRPRICGMMQKVQGWLQPSAILT